MMNDHRAKAKKYSFHQEKKKLDLKQKYQGLVFLSKLITFLLQMKNKTKSRISQKIKRH